MKFSKTSLLTATGFAVSAIALASLSACGGGSSSSTPAVKTKTVSISFVPSMGTTAVSCADVLTGVGTTAVKAKINDLRFYISNIKMLDANDKETPVTVDTSNWQYQYTSSVDGSSSNLSLVDLRTLDCAQTSYNADVAFAQVTGTAAPAGPAPTTFTPTGVVTITGTVPEGTYTGVKMTLGVPEELNHLDPTAAATTPAMLLNSNAPGMSWVWASGRKHFKIEIDPENATTAGVFTGGMTQTLASTTGGAPKVTQYPTWYSHLGNTGCSVSLSSPGGYLCTGSNQLTFHLHTFDPSTQRVAVDLAALYAGNNVTVDSSNPPGCMSGATDVECPPMFNALNASVHGAGIFKAIAK